MHPHRTPDRQEAPDPSRHDTRKRINSSSQVLAGQDTGDSVKVHALTADDDVRGAGRHESRVDAMIVEVLLLQHKHRPATGPVKDKRCRWHVNCISKICCNVRMGFAACL